MDNKTCHPVNTTRKGSEAEQKALAYLVQKGFELVEQNYRAGRGEIDLIVLDKSKMTSELVFVEVRSLMQANALLFHSLGYQKQRKLFLTAQSFLKSHPNFYRGPWRFDIIWIQAGAFIHWKNVFLES